MGDGLTTEEFTELKDIFELWEEKDSGKINVGDLENVMRAWGLNPTQAEMEELTQGKDGKSKFDFDDVREIISKKPKPNDPMSVLREAFKVLDKNEKGSLDAKYFRQIMTEYGDVLDEEEADEMIRDAIDSDGKINYEEFIFKVLNPETK